MKLLLVENVKPVVAQIAECLADWYKRAQTIYLKVKAVFNIGFKWRILKTPFKLQTQILAKDVITCDDALYTLREQIFSKKEDVKSEDVTRVCERF